jgi:hypothetical protein
MSAGGGYAGRITHKPPIELRLLSRVKVCATGTCVGLHEARAQRNEARRTVVEVSEKKKILRVCTNHFVPRGATSWKGYAGSLAHTHVQRQKFSAVATAPQRACSRYHRETGAHAVLQLATVATGKRWP